MLNLPLEVMVWSLLGPKAQQMNEVMLLHLIKTYCLPRLLYGCDVWPLASINMHDINVLWNNGLA